uniref:Uncharacterized protein n=1 Tax=Pseudomonas phage Arace01 TaxID=3138526 RepID=A0AAU6VZ81_9VIRU
MSDREQGVTLLGLNPYGTVDVLETNEAGDVTGSMPLCPANAESIDSIIQGLQQIKAHITLHMSVPAGTTKH